MNNIPCEICIVNACCTRKCDKLEITKDNINYFVDHPVRKKRLFGKKRSIKISKEIDVQIDYSVAWFKNGKLHREDGPAIQYINGAQAWFINGKRHRIDGPALICYQSGTKEWWLNNKLIKEETTN
jgi:hypothetical protein